MDLEKRGGLPAEIRSDDSGIKVSGYAAVFDQPADIGGFFTEVIAPGAFRAAIERGDDVVFLINHEDLPLARTRSGTLTIKEDKHGLKIETELDADDPDVKSIVPKMRRGDLDKMSFAFRVEKDSWDETVDPPVRTIQQVRLHDVSIVTTPAYDGTSIAMRSLESSRKERKKEQKKHNHHGASRRLERKAQTDHRIRNI